ncbi:tyrosine-type recombinase/integrase [Caballeronia sp. LZ029]|uniref:tyrosine-type recombinase/integrase n=1 Tax=Caballeronia sp. LZ029 TaxID=3038564 RepID=UPI002854C9AE|nr:integrase arm-type DNA-binding domain-containing protein [Caballeronia sp. LZ029]MDR5743242.1 tyrosine-type recombinase/integrase [Caballeronia sp. LZ029]
MAKAINRLSQAFVNKTAAPGDYCDGNGLYLQITKNGVKSWLFRYMRQGRARYMGLGPLHTVGLADARTRSLECRRLLLDGIDPLDAKQKERAADDTAKAKAMSFDECATAYIEAHRGGWKNEKHGEQWKNTLATYAGPVFGKLPVADVDTGLVMKVLEPIWYVKTETASRVRGRIESVIDWAKVRGYRTGENPARWRGHLDKLLPKRSNVQKVEHHAALPYAELGAFFQEVQKQEGAAARALELLILTAARTGEIIGARREEFDLKAKVWTIPAARMKMGKEHRVPLSPAALAIVKDALAAGGDYLFCSPGKKDKPLSNMALLALLKRMGRDDLTAHGFRSVFRDWSGETTNFPREVIEAALAHGLKSKVEAAYARGDLFVKRAKLMDQWAAYAQRVPTEKKVVEVPFGRRNSGMQ